VLESRAITADGKLVEISRYSFDAENRLISIARRTGCTDGSQAQPTEVFEYDAGHLVRHEQISSPVQLGHVLRYAYDGHANLRAIEFSGNVTGRKEYNDACW
jgi:YD repeat-containing protein